MGQLLRNPAREYRQSQQNIAWFHRRSPTSSAETESAGTPYGAVVEKKDLKRYQEQNEPIHSTTHLLNAEQIEKVDRIFHKILWLDMMEASILTHLLNQRWGIKLSPKQNRAIEKLLENEMLSASGQGGAASKGDGDVGEAADQGPKLVELRLVGFDAKAKIKVIKEVRAITGLGLKEAKELVEAVESSSKVIASDLKDEDATAMKEKVEAAGGKVEIS